MDSQAAGSERGAVGHCPPPPTHPDSCPTGAPVVSLKHRCSRGLFLNEIIAIVSNHRPQCGRASECWPQRAGDGSLSEFTIRSWVVTLRGTGVPNGSHRCLPDSSSWACIRTHTHTTHPHAGPSLPTKSGSYPKQLSPHPLQTSQLPLGKGVRARAWPQASTTRATTGQDTRQRTDTCNHGSGQLWPRCSRGTDPLPSLVATGRASAWPVGSPGPTVSGGAAQHNLGLRSWQPALPSSAPLLCSDSPPPPSKGLFLGSSRAAG